MTINVRSSFASDLLDAAVDAGQPKAKGNSVHRCDSVFSLETGLSVKAEITL